MPILIFIVLKLFIILIVDCWLLLLFGDGMMLVASLIVCVRCLCYLLSWCLSLGCYFVVGIVFVISWVELGRCLWFCLLGGCGLSFGVICVLSLLAISTLLAAFCLLFISYVGCDCWLVDLLLFVCCLLLCLRCVGIALRCFGLVCACFVWVV